MSKSSMCTFALATLPDLNLVVGLFCRSLRTSGVARLTPRTTTTFAARAVSREPSTSSNWPTSYSPESSDWENALAEPSSERTAAASSSTTTRAPGLPKRSFREKVRTPEYSNSLFVSNLPYSATTDDLRAHFLPIGPIRPGLTFVVKDKDTQMSKGVGFVSFLDKADCERAITELHGSRLEGSDSQRPIRVEVIGQPGEIKKSTPSTFTTTPAEFTTPAAPSSASIPKKLSQPRSVAREPRASLTDAQRRSAKWQVEKYAEFQELTDEAQAIALERVENKVALASKICDTMTQIYSSPLPVIDNWTQKQYRPLPQGDFLPVHRYGVDRPGLKSRKWRNAWIPRLGDRVITPFNSYGHIVAFRPGRIKPGYGGGPIPSPSSSSSPSSLSPSSTASIEMPPDWLLRSGALGADLGVARKQELLDQARRDGGVAEEKQAPMVAEVVLELHPESFGNPVPHKVSVLRPATLSHKWVLALQRETGYESLLEARKAGWVGVAERAAKQNEERKRMEKTERKAKAAAAKPKRRESKVKEVKEETGEEAKAEGGGPAAEVGEMTEGRVVEPAKATESSSRDDSSGKQLSPDSPRETTT